MAGCSNEPTAYLSASLCPRWKFIDKEHLLSTLFSYLCVSTIYSINLCHNYFQLICLYKVADMSLAEFGRKEIEIAEHEMPGLMALMPEIRRSETLERRTYHRLTAYDYSDGSVNRNISCVGSGRGLAATSSPHRTMRRRLSQLMAYRYSLGKARRWRSIGGVRTWRFVSRKARPRYDC